MSNEYRRTERHFRRYEMVIASAMKTQDPSNWTLVLDGRQPSGISVDLHFALQGICHNPHWPLEEFTFAEVVAFHEQWRFDFELPSSAHPFGRVYIREKRRQTYRHKPLNIVPPAVSLPNLASPQSVKFAQERTALLNLQLADLGLFTMITQLLHRGIMQHGVIMWGTLTDTHDKILNDLGATEVSILRRVDPETDKPYVIIM